MAQPRNQAAINAAQRQIANAEKQIKNLELRPLAWEDALMMTRPIDDETDELFRITTHIRIANGGLALPRTTSPIEYWRLIEIPCKGSFDTVVCDLSTYAERKYTITAWLAMMQREFGIDEEAGRRHLDSHAVIKDEAFMPGERRLIFWGPSGPTINRWRGYTVEPDEFGRESGIGYCPELAYWLHTVYVRICHGSISHFKRFISFFAFMVQCPTQKPGIALMLTSRKQGTGKNSVVLPIDEIVGRHSRIEATSARLTAEANAVLGDLKIAFVDECVRQQFGMEEEATAKLQSLITEPMVSMRRLYQDAVNTMSYTMFVFCSNKPDAGLQVVGGRRFQFMPVVDERLEPHVGALLKNPRDKKKFHGQLLHLLSTIKFQDALHVVVETEGGNRVRREQFLESVPIAKPLFELSCHDDEWVMRSFLGCKEVARRRRVVEDPAQSRAWNADRADQVRVDFVEAAKQYGWFAMPRTTYINNMANQINSDSSRQKGGHKGVLNHITQFNDRLLRNYKEEDLRRMRMDPQSVEQMHLVEANSVIVPTYPAGWRYILTHTTQMSYEEVCSLFEVNVDEEQAVSDIRPFGEEDARALCSLSESWDDEMWLDISDMIEHVEYHRQLGIGAFHRHLPPDAPLLLNVAELQAPNGGSQAAWRRRPLIAALLRRFNIPETLQRHVLPLLNIIADFPEDRLISTPSAVLIVDALDILHELPEGCGMEGIINARIGNPTGTGAFCHYIVTHDNFVLPDITVDDFQENSQGYLEDAAGSWRLDFLRSFEVKIREVNVNANTSEFLRQMNELLRPYPVLFGRFNQTLESSMMPGHAAISRAMPFENRIDALAHFFNNALPLPNAVTGTQAESLLIGHEFAAFMNGPGEGWLRFHGERCNMIPAREVLREVWDCCHRLYDLGEYPSRNPEDEYSLPTNWDMLFIRWREQLCHEA